MADPTNEEVENLRVVLAAGGAEAVAREILSLREQVRLLRRDQASVRGIAEVLLVPSIAEKIKAADLLDSLSVTAETIFSEDNLHSLEYTQDGFPYRWSGPARSTVFALNLDRSHPLVCCLSFINTGIPLEEFEALVSVSVDSEAVSYRCQSSSSLIDIYFGLPPRAVHQTTTVTVEATTKQATNEDKRFIGVPFHRVSISKKQIESKQSNGQ